MRVKGWRVLAIKKLTIQLVIRKTLRDEIESNDTETA